MLDTLRHGFLVLDGNLRVTSASACFFREFHVTKQDTIGRLVYEIGGRQWDIPRLRDVLEKIIPSDGFFEDFEVEHDFPGLGHRTMILNARRLEMESGAPQILLSIEDVTARRAAEKALGNSEMRYRRLFQTAKDGILILDAASGKIIDANAFMSGLLGWEVRDIIGRELHEIGLFKDVKENKSVFQDLQRDGYARYDHLPVQSRNGTVTPVEFVSNVYLEGKHRVAQCNVRDISSRVLLEAEVQRQAERLADQYRRKDEFLAMLSHELRNPLAPIRSATHLLKLQETGDVNSIQRGAREVIERQVANLTRLVEDLLEVSRIVSGRIRMRLEVLDATQVVRHAVEASRTQLERRKHRLTLDFPGDPVWVHADSTRLEQVVLNLLDNAIKFTDEGGEIGVRLERSGASALLRVRDSGIGIAPEVLPRVFDLFTQVDQSLHRSRGGLGIGLHLVERLTELMGGSVSAVSAGLGRGSEFVIRLPLAKQAEPQAPATTAGSEEPSARGKLRVLVVDDNLDGCNMLAALLQQKGYSVRTAYAGPAALDAALLWQPDVALIDIGLPGLDGYEVARRIRSNPAMPKARLIALTGYGAPEDFNLAHEAGFDAHLLKPVGLEQIEMMIRG